MNKIKRIAMWFLWLSLITAPFLWIRIDYDFATKSTLARFRSERFEFVFLELPRWFIDQLFGVLGVLVAVAVLGWLIARWQKGKWAAWRDAVTASCRTKFKPLTNALLFVVLLALLVTPPLAFTDKYLDMSVFVFMYIILALGLNITVGMTGLLVLGYAAFFAIGAYTFAILQREFGMPFWIAFAPAAVVGAAAGFLLGLPSLRLRGDYLAIVTLGFGETTRFILKNLSGLTGGDFGIIVKAELKIPIVTLPFGLGELSRVQMAYILIFLIAVISVAVLNRINHSRIGRAWIAIREDETAAAAMGINTVRLKILAFTLSAIWAAIAGVFYAAYAGFVDPETFRFEESVLILSMVVLGGMGSSAGVIVGAIVLYIVPRLLRDQFPVLIDYRLMIFGATMVVMMVFRPQGIVGTIRRKIELKPQEDA